MTLMKSILLGSAAGIVAVASAQAADLPTRKAAPVAQYVKICNVGGITGWTLPGSDTCVKLSGYVSAQVVGGNLSTQYNWASTGLYTAVTGKTLPVTQSYATQRVLVAGSAAQGNTTFNRNETGWTTRGELDLDVASNTAYGPLLGHIAIRGDMGNGLDTDIGNGVNAFYADTAYLTWAGITAGKAASFYSFIGGGDNYANMFSPDQKGWNEPLLLAYTASFGGGFSATLAAQSAGSNGYSGGGTDLTGSNGCPNAGTLTGCNPGSITYGGQRWPDIVGALHVTQGWGEAQVSGVLHNVNVTANGLSGDNACGVAGVGAGLEDCNSQKTQTGWGVDAGVKINLPSFGAGDNVVVTGSYTQSAVWYSGLPDGMWGENGQVNGNGQPMNLADAFFNPLTNQWSKPTAWSVSALLEHHFTPQVYVDLEGSIGGLKWSNMGGGCNILSAGCSVAQAIQGPLSPSAFTWLIGADLGWNPVTNLNFDLELMYQAVNQTTPSGFLGTVYNYGSSSQYFVPGDWKGNSGGFAGRFRITRYF
jgi:hypothetical protein